MPNLDRPLAAPLRDPHGRRSILRRVGLVLGVLFAVGFLVSRLDLHHTLKRLDVGFVSGSREGNYYAIVEQLAALAAKREGKIRNVESSGSADTLARLGRGSCDVTFGLAQDGSEWGQDVKLVARLPRMESVFFLGKNGDAITELAELKGMRVGIGPVGSGTEHLARQFFGMSELSALGVRLENHPNVEQLALAEKGDLDLAMFVIDEDAPFIADAIRDHGLALAGFAHLDALSRRMPHFKTGRIGAGQYEAVKILPPVDKRVLRVETIVVANHCASRSQVMDLLEVLRQRFPEIVRHAKETDDTTGLPVAEAAKNFVEHDGPELADEYVPWLVDVMPPANWAYVVMGVSLLFNAMGAGHRFRLWRIDDARVKLEGELTSLFGPGVTLGDISRREPADVHLDDKVKDGVDSLIARFDALAARSRRQSLSALVPMGQEMAYRYQEEIIYESIAVLRDFRRRRDVAVSRKSSV